MAGSIASLFGPSAEQIVYDRQKEERERQDLNFYRGLQAIDVPGVATGMVAGRGIGQGLTQAAQGLFGTSQQLEDPKLAKALAMRKVFEGVTAADLRDPDKLEAMAQKAIDYGNVEAAFQLDSMAIAAREAATPELTKLGTQFEVDGELVYGGYDKYGRPVGVDQNGTQFALPTTAREVSTGTLDAPKDWEMSYAEKFGDKLDIDDDLLIMDLAGKAKAVQAEPGNSRLDFATAMQIAYLRGQPLNVGTSVNSLGLSRAAQEGENVYLLPNNTLVITDSTGKIVVQGTKELTPNEIKRLNARSKRQQPRPVTRNTGGYGQGLAREPETRDVLTESQVLF